MPGRTVDNRIAFGRMYCNSRWNFATPGLHNASAGNRFCVGCMITMSHNPVSDSGIKVFDSSDSKLTALEKEISELVVQLVAEEREAD